MFRLVADVRLRTEVLFSLWRVNRSARSRSAICRDARCGGGGRLGDCELIIQSFSKPEKT
jgi:hypothetical protein